MAHLQVKSKLLRLIFKQIKRTFPDAEFVIDIFLSTMLVTLHHVWELLKKTQLRFSLECYTCLLVHSIIYMSWHTLTLYCSGSHQAGTKAKRFRAGCVILFVQWDKSWERIRKQLYMSCRGFSSAHRRAWTSSWMKFTCKLWTKARPSANKGEEKKKCRKRVTEKKKRGSRKGKTLAIKSIFNLLNNGSLGAQQSGMQAGLTSSFFVLYQNLQLQQPPRNIGVIPHHGQSGLKLAFDPKLYSAISYVKKKTPLTTKQWNKHLRAEQLSTFTGGYENNYMHYSGFKRLAHQLWGLPTGGAGLWWRGDVAGSDSAGSGSSAFQTWWWDLEEWSCPAQTDAEMFMLTNAKEKTFDNTTLVFHITRQIKQPYSYTCGQARVRPCGENIYGEGDGKTGQTGMYEGISGQRC